MDDTANVIDALKDRFPAINAPEKMTFVMPPKIAKMRLNCFLVIVRLCWLWAAQTRQILIACVSLPSEWAGGRI